MPLGAFPLDPETPVGQLRVLIGDTHAVPTDPPTPGLAEYDVYGDNDLASAIAVAQGNLPRAAGNLLTTLAAEYAMEGKSIKTDDLSIDTTKRGATLLEVARAFLDEAGAVDQRGASDYFDMVLGPDVECEFGQAFNW